MAVAGPIRYDIGTSAVAERAEVQPQQPQPQPQPRYRYDMMSVTPPAAMQTDRRTDLSASQSLSLRTARILTQSFAPGHLGICMGSLPLLCI